MSVTPIRTLGLDLGSNSIGWALVEDDGRGKPQAIIDCGVRVFPEPMETEGGKEKPKNRKRREARLARRVLDRRARRRKRLTGQLVCAGLLPGELLETTEPEKILNELVERVDGDPYALRKKALDEPLEPHEVGRVILHLCARRGFQSNRKTRWGSLVDDPDVAGLIADAEGDAEDDTRNDAEKERQREEKKVLEEIEGLRKSIETSGKRTLGEYLADLDKGERRRGRHTDRQMYKDEFELVWDKQQQYHEVLRDDGLKAELYKTIFHQRPLKLKRGRLGYDVFEPQRRRAAAARLECQRFRYLQDLNHLEVRDRTTGEDVPLTAEQRSAIAEKLEVKSTMTWGAARKAAGISRFMKFNLEESGTKDLKGNRTAASIRNVILEWWDGQPEAERVLLVEDLLTIHDKRSLMKRLIDHWGFEREHAFRLAILEFEGGHSNHSLKAIKRMTPELEKGLSQDKPVRYSDARKAACYGYDKAREAIPFLDQPPDVPNPVVQKALFEVRKVVNAIIIKYGKPDVIRVELPREMKKSKKELDRINRQNAKNKKLNDVAERAAKEKGILNPSRDYKIKYRLWIESNQRCPYTGKTISLRELFGQNVDVEHIIPYSRLPNNSYMNKTLCMADENRNVKRNRTPWEAYHDDKVKWEQIIQRVKKFPPPKMKRFLQEKIEELDDFISRQLNDTGYISRLAKDYLGRLGVKSVEAPRGGTTAMLRWRWQLNHLLGDAPAPNNSRRKPRHDHRHHAIDAIVVALTDRSVYQSLVRSAERESAKGQSGKRFKIDPPWPGFSKSVDEALVGIAVSYAPQRKILGALHEETSYGLRYVPEIGEERFVRRKRLDSQFTWGMAQKVVDPILRKPIEARFRKLAEESRKELNKIRGAFTDEEPLCHPRSGVLVRRVRLQENRRGNLVPVYDRLTRDEKPFKYMLTGKNHHVEIFKNRRTGKIEPCFVTMKEAAERARIHKRPIVDKERDGMDFLMSLSINEMVELGDGGVERLYRVQNLDSLNNRIMLRLHRAASDEENSEPTRVVRSVNVLMERGMRKVRVGPLGKIKAARD